MTPTDAMSPNGDVPASDDGVRPLSEIEYANLCLNRAYDVGSTTASIARSSLLGILNRLSASEARNAELETAVGLLQRILYWRDHATSQCETGDKAATSYGFKQDSLTQCRSDFDAINSFLARHQRDNAQGEGNEHH